MSAATPTKRVRVCYGVDFDAVAGWLGSYGGEDSSSDISRGVYAGTLGTERLLKLFREEEVHTTWFIPGHSIETFPDQCKQIHDEGHEIGLHGYSHEKYEAFLLESFRSQNEQRNTESSNTFHPDSPADMSIEQQRDVLDHSYRLINKLCGKPPRGSTAPWWEQSKQGAQLLLEYGLEYDHSFQHHDCQPYYLRMGDSWTKIDYTKRARDWMKPLQYGEPTGVVEIPGSWYLDDLPPMMFVKAMPNSNGWTRPQDIESIWMDMFTYLYEENDDFIFPITCHPDVSGRPQVLLMHRRLIRWLRGHKGVEFVTMSEICDDFKARNKPHEKAHLPTEPGAKLRETPLLDLR